MQENTNNNESIKAYREIIRQEIIRQNLDPKELDSVTDNSLEFYRDNYKSNEQVAKACVYHYR